MWLSFDFPMFYTVVCGPLLSLPYNLQSIKNMTAAVKSIQSKMLGTTASQHCIVSVYPTVDEDRLNSATV